MTIEIRSPLAHELPQMVEVNLGAFGEVPDAWHQRWFEARFEPGRAVVAVDGTQIVGCSLWYPIEMGLPGGSSPAAAVSGVSVLPTHRRRGLLRAMMGRLLEYTRDEGMPMAALQASEGAIYSRFGFGPAARALRLRLELSRVQLPAGTDVGRLQLVGRELALSLLPQVHQRLVRARPGVVARGEFAWRELMADDDPHGRRERAPLFHLVHTWRGRPEGYVLYRIRPAWKETGPNGCLQIVEMASLTSRAASALWRHCLAVDLVRQVEATELGAWRPEDEPLLWLATDPQAVSATLGTSLWVRINDVRRSLEQRRYQADGELTFELRRGAGSEEARCYRLEVRRGRGRCRPASGPPELSLGLPELGSAYLGQRCLAQLARAGRVTEHRAGTARAADELLSWDPPPWCFEDL